MSKKDRKKTANISSVKNNTSKAYRQRLLLKQADALTAELLKVRQEEESYALDGVIRQRVFKRKGTRIALRVVGTVFFALGIMFMWWAMGGSYRIVKMLVAMTSLTYSFYVIRGSFKSSAYDATYLFGNDVITILQKKGSRVIPYSAVTGYTIIEPDPEMKYYILKFDRGKESFIVPFAGAKGKCEAAYNMLKERVNTGEEQDT